MYNLRNREVTPQKTFDGWLILSIVANNVQSPWLRAKLSVVGKYICTEKQNQISIIEDISDLTQGCIQMYLTGETFCIYDESLYAIASIKVLRRNRIYVSLFIKKKFICKIKNLKKYLLQLTVCNKTFEKFNQIQYPLMAH